MDALGLPVAVHSDSASPHEVTLVERTLAASFIEEKPQSLIGDKAFDSDLLDKTLNEQGIEMIAPHRKNRKRPKTQAGRKLRPYKRRYQVERFFAWLFNFRRTLVRQEQKADNYLAFLLLACMKIMLRYF